jgi:hypothetical protein
VTEPRKPLAALLVAEKEGKGEPADAPAEEAGEEMMLAEDAAAAMGAPDPAAAGAALVDVIRACMAKQRKGGYAK